MLIQTIFQVQYHPRLMIESKIPDDFQNSLIPSLSKYTKQQEFQYEIQVNEDKIDSDTKGITNHVFSSDDNNELVSLTMKSLTFQTHGYTEWEKYSVKFAEMLKSIHEIYRINEYVRVGLRYINVYEFDGETISDSLLEDEIKDPLLGLLNSDIKDDVVAYNQVHDIQRTKDINMRIQTALAENFQNKRKGFIFDLDAYTESITRFESIKDLLDKLHDAVKDVFIEYTKKAPYEK